MFFLSYNPLLRILTLLRLYVLYLSVYYMDSAPGCRKCMQIYSTASRNGLEFKPLDLERCNVDEK
jgi:hypothetical protein